MSFEYFAPFGLGLVFMLAVLSGHVARFGALVIVATVLGGSHTAVFAALDALVPTRLDAELRCRLGVYTLSGRQTVTITGVDGQTRGLRYTLSNGQFGDLVENANGSFSAPMASEPWVVQFEPCGAGKRGLTLRRGKTAERGVRLQLVEQTTTFASDGIQLHGKLVLPRGGRATALAVWIEGSNNDPSTDDTVWQYELASRGVAVFVYDKRGTGASGGVPLSDFYARARDTAAAVREARRLAPAVRRVGVLGGSQGGWVAPLSATLVPVDFVVAAFALAQGPIAQDQALVDRQLRDAGFDEKVLGDAKELTAITEKIVRSNMQDGLAELDAFKSMHAGASWLKAIQPRSYTGLLLMFSTEQIKTNGPAMAQGLSFAYEPLPVIESIAPRQLWLLGGNDSQAPSAGTQNILRQIQQFPGRRSRIAVVVFPNADHGLIEPVQTTGGASLAYSAKLFDVAANWIKAKKLPAAGQFITMPTAN